MARLDFVRDFTVEMKTKWMIVTQTSDMMTYGSSGGMPRSAWPLSAEPFQAQHGIPPEDRQIIMSVVSVSIILYCFENEHIGAENKIANLVRSAIVNN